MYSYKKLFMVTLLGCSLSSAPALNASVEDLLIPVLTGASSGYVYGKLWQTDAMLELLLAKCFFYTCKNRIFEVLAKNYSVNGNGMPFGIYITSKTTPNGHAITSSEITISNDTNDSVSRYYPLSDLDDIITLMAMIATMTIQE